MVPAEGRQAGGAGGGARILFIPEEDHASTSDRTSLALRTLRERHEVVGLRSPWDRIVYDPARPTWPRALLYIADKAILAARAVAAMRRHRAQVVFCETAHHALAGLFAARLVGARCIWDSHGCGRKLFESLGKGPLRIRFVTRLERFLGWRVDALITVSEADATAYVEMGLPASKVHVVPVSVDLREIDRLAGAHPGPSGGAPDGVPILLLFGSFRYEPNREALEFVNGTLAPHLERLGVRCEIQVAGRDVPLLAFHRTVRVVGFVPNIYETIRAAAVCLVPVRRGVGVLTKVIDTMAVGTPVVLSGFAAEGIPEIRHGVHGLVAETDEAFLRHVVAALSDPASAHGMALQARRLVEAKFDWRAYTPFLDAIIRGPGRPAPPGGHHGSRTHHAGR